jgi:asparagine synthase (glutamine-hydrolysing)
MCGIAGWVAPRGAAIPAGTMEAMLDAIAHRGPDGLGQRAFVAATTGHEVMLGHRRLAIIDPNGAHQPMCDDVAGLALSFNGEIYNFRELREELVRAGMHFSRMSDTEVLLRGYQVWGMDVVHRLRGMYAFAIWDARRERLFVARDRFGEKPLFVHEGPRGLAFASEIKALLAIPGIEPGVDLGAVRDYLAYRYVPAPRTLYQGIRKLMPGSYGVWERGTFREERYWTPPDRKPRASDFERAPDVNGFLAKLEDSVRLQMVSDVPFGAFLSGGLDSSTIVALMKRQTPHVKTFSVGFPEVKYSELRHAATVARHCGTEHHELVIDPEDLIEELPKLVAFRDAPVCEPSDIAIYRLAREAGRTVKMVLTGEGSDELLGGYPKHAAERFTAAYQSLPSGFRRGLVEPLVNSLPYQFRRAKTAVANFALEDRQDRYPRWFGALDGDEINRLSALPATARVNGVHAFDTVRGNTTLRDILYFDQTSWLPDNLLERGDRMTMAASIESRVPFLDHELAEYVSDLPDSHRLRGLNGKWILRQAAAQLLPKAILERKKVGFRVPVNEWFRGPMRGYLQDHLQGAGSRTRHYYDPKVLDAMIADHLEGRHNREKVLWTLLNLEVWHRQHAAA